MQKNKILNIVAKIKASLDEIDLLLKDKASLVREIEEDKLRPIKIVRATSNPFTITVSRHTWTKLEENLIEYCASNSTPPSQRTLEHLKKKIPKSVSNSAIRNKLRSMGYQVKKGIICKK